MLDIITTYLLPSVYAFLACVGFCFIFNIHGTGVIVGSLGGGIAWLVYLLCGSSIMAGFLAAMAVGAYSEAMARLRRCPATGYVLIGLLPLVPGGGIYYAMSYCVGGYKDLFLIRLLNTFGMAAALAIGAMLSASLFRALFPRFPHFARFPYAPRWRR